MLGNAYTAGGLFDQALAEYRRALRLDPVSALALGLGPALPSGPAEVYLRQERYQQAVDDFLRVATLRNATASEMDSMRSAFARSGIQGFMRRWLDLDLRQSGANADPMRIAALWAWIGDTEQALAYLERAYSERNPGLDLCAHRFRLREAACAPPLRAHRGRNEVPALMVRASAFLPWPGAWSRL